MDSTGNEESTSLSSHNPYGYWDGSDALFPVERWQADVANDKTRLGYDEWVKGRYAADPEITVHS